VLLIAFSGEELGLLGSTAYVRAPAIPLDRTYAMINLDMVGRLRNDRLLVFGVLTAKEFPALLDSLNRKARFDLKTSGDGYGPSDQQSFFVAKKSVLHLFTDLHEDYHRSTDDWDKINYGGLERVAVFTADLARVLGNRTAPLTFVDAAPAPAHAAGSSSGSGYGAYFGSVPDMSGGVEGVRLSGVRPDSPADRAGIKAGDVLLEMGGTPVPDLQAMTDVLRSHQPGDTIAVVFRRGTVVDTTRAVLGKRG
jgi:C-terminal processing protease CtpA/Prc